MTRPDSPLARLAVTAVALCAALPTVGCQSAGQQAGPFVGRAALPADISKDELVAHLNAQAARTAGWRCRKIAVKVPNAPADASGMLAVQYPRRLRLKANVLNLAVADVGSNADRIWCWVNPRFSGGPAETLTCRHASFDAVRTAAATGGGGPVIPFDPDWLMEVLGVAPLDPRCVRLQLAPDGGPLWHLVSHRSDPGGRRVLRIIHVDAAHGQVLAHELRDATTKRLIARAELQDHQRDEATGVVLPHRIELVWPEGGVPPMTLTLGQIDVNPPDLQDSLWDMPAKRKVRLLDDGGRVTTAAACCRP